MDSKKPRTWRLQLHAEHAIAAYLVLAFTGLIVLRAVIGSLAFLSVGWMLALVVFPLIPWLLPRLGEFLREISPYVQSLKLGSIQLDFRTLRREPIVVPASGTLAPISKGSTELSSAHIVALVMSLLRQVRREGGGPVGIVDLQDGRKWRLPNVYFLALLLEVDPVVRQFVLTEMRGDIDGYLVGSCRPDELRRQTEQAVPAYAEASPTLLMPVGPDLADPVQAEAAAKAFGSLLTTLPPTSGADDDPVHGYVTSGRIRAIMDGILSSVAVEAVSETLSEEDMQAILGSPHRFVPTTRSARVTGVIDREAVALSVARAAMARV